jgi:hypothetical protein
MAFRNFSIFFAMIWSFAASAQTYQAGTVYFSPNNYIEYRAGNLPIIITAPHGGDLLPASIPDRNCVGCVYVTDANTADLASRMDMALQTSIGGYPHIIINHLQRIKLDANREIVEAANGNAESEAAWHEWEKFVIAARADITQKWGRGLMIDVHGHGHTIQRLELGFALSAAELRLSDATLATATYRDQTGIKNNIINNLNGFNTPAMIRGEFALGTLLAARGYPSVPSRQDVAPASSDPYFDGGYNTVRYGSRDSMTIDAIQIECNFTGVRNTEANRTAFATQSADALKIYLSKHYFTTLPIELLNFSGFTEGGRNHLSWTTVNEINNKGFCVERLNPNTNNWLSIGFVVGQNKGAYYTYSDNDPFDVSYYRLRQIDYDGKETLSKIVAISAGNNSKLKIYPSVSNAFLTIETSQIGQYQIFNLLGQQVLISPIASRIDVSVLPQGTYILKVGEEKAKFVKY